MRRFGYEKWDGFKNLESDGKRFIYDKDFPAAKRKIGEVIKHFGDVNCRVPEHDLRVYKKLYWGD
jgi:hypothetical protein